MDLLLVPHVLLLVGELVELAIVGNLVRIEILLLVIPRILVVGELVELAMWLPRILPLGSLLLVMEMGWLVRNSIEVISRISIRGRMVMWVRTSWEIDVGL